MAVALPSGDVTFLMSDIEGSTELLRSLGRDDYTRLLVEHDDIVRAAVREFGGSEVDRHGDSFLFVFPEVTPAARAAMRVQERISADGRLALRIGLCRGVAAADPDRGYVALAVHQCERICGAANGGQIFAEAELAESLGDEAPTMPVRPLGAFWLKDFASPVELVAIGPGPTLPPRAVAVALGAIPAIPGALIGREAELTGVRRALAEHGSLTLTGPGGVGKTRLALELAHELHQATSPVWWIDLSSVADADTPFETVLAAASTVAASHGGLPHLAAKQARTGAILVIDDAERLIEGVAELVSGLRALRPALPILVTSREPLGTRGEQVIRLAPLRVPSPGSSAAESVTAPAVRLFVDAAERVEPTFSAFEHLENIVELCRELDGVPLALQLAAARMSSLGPADVLRRVRDVGEIPGVGERGKRDRRGALHAVLEWSLADCSEVQKRVLRQLAVFAGAVPLELVTGIVADAESRTTSADVEDAVVALTAKSLVFVSSAADGRKLYSMLTTVRTRARAQLDEAGGLRAAYARHADLLIAGLPFVERWYVDRNRSAELWAESFAAIQRGLGSLVDRARLLELVVRNAHELASKHPVEGFSIATRVLETGVDDPATRAVVHLTLINAAHASGAGDLPELHATALAVARELGDPTILCNVLIAPAGGLREFRPGDDVPADYRASIDEAGRLLPAIEGRMGRSLAAMYWNSVGLIALADRDFTSARAAYRTAATCVARGTGPDLGVFAYNIAEIDELEGDPSAAEVGYADAARELAAAEIFTLAAPALLALAAIQRELNKLAVAGETYAEAVLTARRSGVGGVLLQALTEQSVFAAEIGDHALARRAAADAVALGGAVATVAAGVLEELDSRPVADVIELSSRRWAS